MNDLTPIEALAADYVLGQLDQAERSAVAARLAARAGADGRGRGLGAAAGAARTS